MLIFSILNHPCSFMVYYFFGVFLSWWTSIFMFPSIKGNFVRGQNNTKFRDRAPFFLPPNPWPCDLDIFAKLLLNERHVDEMVFEFDSGLSGLSSRARHNSLLSQYLFPPRCINGYKRITCWVVTRNWQDSNPGGGESKNTPSRFILKKPKISVSFVGHLA